MYQSKYHQILYIIDFVHPYLSPPVGGDASHVVVDRGDDRDGLPGHVHAGKDHGSLGDAGQPEIRRCLAYFKMRSAIFTKK